MVDEELDILAVQETQLPEDRRFDIEYTKADGTVVKFKLVLFAGVKLDRTNNNLHVAGVGFVFRAGLNAEVEEITAAHCQGRLCKLLVPRDKMGPLRVLNVYAPLSTSHRTTESPERNAGLDAFHAAILDTRPHILLGDFNIDPECPLAQYSRDVRALYAHTTSQLKLRDAAKLSRSTGWTWASPDLNDKRTAFRKTAEAAVAATPAPPPPAAKAKRGQQTKAPKPTPAPAPREDPTGDDDDDIEHPDVGYDPRRSTAAGRAMRRYRRIDRILMARTARVTNASVVWPKHLRIDHKLEQVAAAYSPQRRRK
jgi:exonuclease III